MTGRLGNAADGRPRVLRVVQLCWTITGPATSSVVGCSGPWCWLWWCYWRSAGLADAGRVAVWGGLEGSAVTEGLSEWVSPHRLRPTDSDSGQLRPAQPGPAAPVPVPGVGVDGLPHLFGLPQARNAVCGMAAVTGPDQVELAQAHRGPAVSDRDLVVTCPGCLDWPLPATEFS